MTNSTKAVVKFAPVVLAAALVAGCGGGGGSSSDTTSDSSLATSQTSTGTAVDFYLSGSTVTFANANCAATTTDTNGQFTIPRADCGVITIKNGVDVATNLPFKGVFTAPAGSTVVTPVTTLMQSLIASGKLPIQAQSTVMAALGLTQDPTTTDPMKDPDALAKTMALVQIAQQTAETFSTTPGVTTANFEDIYASILKQVGSLLPSDATAALDAAFVTAAAQATAREVSAGNEVAISAAKAIGPTVAEIAQVAAEQIESIKTDLSNTRGNATEALALVTSRSDIDDSIKTLTALSTSLATELRKHDLATTDAAMIASIATQIVNNINPRSRVSPPIIAPAPAPVTAPVAR